MMARYTHGMQEKIKKDTVEPKVICPECGKPRAARGRLTGWLFSEKQCTCFLGGILTPQKPVKDEIEAQPEPLPGAEELGPDFEF